MTQPSFYADFWVFIRLLSDNRLLRHVTRIGSWAEYLYALSGILPGFSANIRTLDMDFLINNQNKPNPGVNLAAIAQEAGYVIDYDTITSATKLYAPSGMEVEFLVHQQGKGDMDVLKTNLGVNAQALRHLSILREHSVPLYIRDLLINVPVPEAYVLHKLMIQPTRGNKQIKR